MIPPTVGNNPLAPCSTPVERWLITGNCHSPCFVSAKGEAGVSSSVIPCSTFQRWTLVGFKPGQEDMEDKMLPMQHVPPLNFADGSKGTAGLLQFGTRAVEEAARTMLSTTKNYLRDSDSGFFLRIYSRSLSRDRVCRKVAEVINQGLHSARWATFPR